MDGADVRVYEPSLFDRHMYSHKFRAAGLRYEIGVSIGEGYIIWVNGPFKCGAKPDVTIFRERMRMTLRSGERVVAD